MFRLFRKIRHQLLDKQKFGKYLIYALGELVLIVIGILLALQIDNWNQSNKEEDALSKNLMELNTHLQSDISFYKENLQQNEAVIDYLKSALEGSYDQIDLSRFNRMVMINTVIINTAYPYENLISSGRINEIRDDSITFKIRQYYEIDRLAYEGYSKYHESSVTENIEGFIITNVLCDNQGLVVVDSLIPELQQGMYNGILFLQTENLKAIQEIMKRNLVEAENLSKSIDSYLMTN